MSVRVAANARRAELLAWLSESPMHHDLTAREIAEVSGIYVGNGRVERCSNDLKALEREGSVWRSDAYPAEWVPEAAPSVSGRSAG